MTTAGRSPDEAPVVQTGRFDGQVIVITGSALGIGRATAIRFGAEGAIVACLDNDGDQNARTVRDLVESGTVAIAITCDVRDFDSQRSAFDGVIERFGRIDVLVACAGVYVGGPLTEIPLDRWRNIEAVNLTGVLLSNQLAASHMIGQRSGAIINISSMAAKTSWPNSAEYSATKSGVIGITRSVAMELGPHGITCNAVCPGNTLTDMVRAVAVEVGATVDMSGPEWLEMRGNDTAMRRLGEPWEVAGVIAFLASADARYITGQAIEVDGGIIFS